MGSFGEPREEMNEIVRTHSISHQRCYTQGERTRNITLAITTVRGEPFGQDSGQAPLYRHVRGERSVSGVESMRTSFTDVRR